MVYMATADCSPKLDNGNTSKWRDIPAFTASLSDVKNINAKEIVKFDKVWTNNGNHYNPNTGIFIAPREGLYHVSTTLMSVSGKTLYAHICLNESRTVGLFPGTGYSEATANIVLHLKKGDKITVRGSGNHPYLYSSSAHYSMFSAYLIA
ncbi:complement C1q-like protein 3 isoform X2 [Mytilus galloprovincialis]|uniref:complement C1q-like protein 3 isoform X2 n=1 Tax=Mytilus galloprovincialis TaxID=29158 RepID=UPI003F7C0BF6